MKKYSQTLPIDQVVVNRVLIIVVVLLALLAGYFHARYTNQEKLYTRLLNKYVDLQDRLDPPKAVKQS